MILHATGWQVIASVSGVSLQVIVAWWGARLTSRNARATIDVQRLVTERTASSFIADKRQKWIDELRTDVARCLALGQEISEAWRAWFSCTGEILDEVNRDPRDQIEEVENHRRVFINLNAPRDREHSEHLLRVRMRLNLAEGTHQDLMRALFHMRATLDELAEAAKLQQYGHNAKFDSIDADVQHASTFASVILKEEWNRLKREVAHPDQLLASIPSSP
ncbi:hypothetical protein LFL96_01015 [Paraburkholderia sp. D15]|uniref:hypothetical protein n=1 Tax=Paraburkholderia sp. D15 TaxID=2880218 RepID=UPI002478590A|nr:hypothetical protein [Paraburkholderia sp. D15]WGS50122.1 hypothetical protein LFL96_01015 [Paraburkholderia sp. D15]